MDDDQGCGCLTVAFHAIQFCCKYWIIDSLELFSSLMTLSTLSLWVVVFEPVYVNSVAPQGSIFGPLLFNMHLLRFDYIEYNTVTLSCRQSSDLVSMVLKNLFLNASK